jgi:mono/diheme cytochrome c family protein
MLRSDPTPTLRACAIVASLVVALATQDAAAQTPADDFRQNCMSCHTIGGGRLTGPDLKDVTTRKERAWLTSFIVDPKAKFDAGDPYAMELKAASQGAVMPNLPNMTSARAEALLVLIEEESKNPASPLQGHTDQRASPDRRRRREGS